MTMHGDLSIVLPLSYDRLMRCFKTVFEYLSRGFWAHIILISLTPVSGIHSNPELPSLGDASSRIVSPELEKRIGKDFLKQIRASMKTSKDPLLKYYTETQIKRLVEYSNFQGQILDIVVVDSPSLNAFAAPGGVVGINLGLFIQAHDVHEFSSVIAHELAHLSQRHFARGIEERKANSLPTMASMIAGLLIGAAGGTDAALATISLAQAASQGNQLRYSREREIEADRIGLVTMVNAGLDPNGQSRMYERMQRAYRFTRRPPEFLLTHPLSETRISDSKNNARAYQIDNVTASIAFQMMKIRSETKYEKNRAVGLNKYRKLAQRDPSNLAYQYGLALALANNNFPGESLEVFEKIKVSLPNTIIMFAAYTDLLRQTGHHEKVQALLKERLSLSPENQPLSMILARSLTATKQFKEAENILIRQSKTRPLDVDVWYELAETSGLAGNISGVHIARAEYFLLHGAYSRSIQHLEYAKSLTRRNNPQLQAKLAQQIQDLKTIVRMAKG